MTVTPNPEPSPRGPLASLRSRSQAPEAYELVTSAISAGVESAAGVLRGDLQGYAVLRSGPRECCQEAGDEGGCPDEPALGPIRLAGPQRRRGVVGEDEHRPVFSSRGYDAEHESLHKIPPKMQSR